MSRRLFFVLGSIAATALAALAFYRTEALSAGSAFLQSGPLRITSVTPRGTDVPPSKQIVFQFDRKVVPVGRMERTAEEIPITIVPSLPCEWRWLNTSALACQLGDDEGFTPETLYRITVNPGIATEDGVTLAAPFQHTFETERPKSTSTYFERWLSPGTPRFRVTFNQRVVRSEVVSKLYFRTAGGARFESTAEFSNMDAEATERYWTVSPARELPLGTRVDVLVDRGMTSLEGELSTLDEKLVVTFYTFPEHTFLGIDCSDVEGREVRVRTDATGPFRPCNPMARVRLVFASPSDQGGPARSPDTRSRSCWWSGRLRSVGISP